MKIILALLAAVAVVVFWGMLGRIAQDVTPQPPDGVVETLTAIGVISTFFFVFFAFIDKKK